MLMDYLGIAIAFSFVILLFSLIVTALSQMTQSLFRMRAQNLHEGLKRIFSEIKFGKDENGKTRKEDKKASGDLALKVMNNSIVSPLSTNSKNLFDSTTYLDTDTFKLALDDLESKELSDDQKKKAKVAYAKLDDWLSKRFALNMRFISIFWAVLVVIAFELSSLDLINEISMDPQLRESLVLAAEQKIASAPTLQSDHDALELASAAALEDLANLDRYDGLSADIESLSGVGVDKEDILREATELFSTLPEGESIINDYNDLIDEHLAASIAAATQELKSLLNEASMLKFEVFEEGMSYWTLNSILGGLMTIIFLSLGAPFWFNNLKNMLALRDMLKPKS